MNEQQPASVRVVHRFAHPAGRVFDACLDPEQARRWMFATKTGQIVGCEIDPRVGGRFAIVDRRDGADVAHTGEYLEVERPRRLVFSLSVPTYSNEVTRVAIEITGCETGCELELVHDDVLPEYVERTRAGWLALLDGLERLLASRAQRHPADS